jgi:hypothetical protein
LHSVANLEALLDAAQGAGRVVILTSDHGHIVERGSELKNIPQSPARWRDPATGPLGDGEILVSGPRVLAHGGTAVLAVADSLRYASKKAGYHGGASLAELTIPILVLKPRGSTNPSGWVEAPPQEPTWWNEPTRASVAPPAEPARSPKQKAPKAVAPTALTLFDAEPAGPSAGPTARPSQPGASMADQLIGSARYIARRGMAGRHPVEDSVTGAVIAALVAGNGRAHRDTVAVAVGVPSGTIAGLLAALRRILNVDGYPVIELDADQVTVTLDERLLREQFEIGADA